MTSQTCIPASRSRYEIRLDGVLDARWGTWFDGLELSSNGSTTTLSGAVGDQSALHGVLNKIRDLGLPLISLRRLT